MSAPRTAYPHTLGRPHWLDDVIAEQKATRERVALYDQTSFGKLLLQGRDALAVLERLCANTIDVAPGRMVYTPLLNARGGFESDLTITRLGVESFLLVTGSAQPTRDADWIGRHIAGNESAALVDVSALTAVLSVMGPNAKELLCRVGAPDTAERLAPDRLRFSATAEIDVGFARVRAARMSYVGGPGFELYVPIETARHVWLALHAAGADLGLVDAGYYALDALRIEAGRRAWGAELGPDETPFEAGTLFAVKLDKPGGFLGRDALLARSAEPPAKRLVSLVFDAPAAWAWGGEALFLDDAPAGEITSAGWSPKLGACVALGYLRGAAAAARHAGSRVEVDVWGERLAATAWDDAARMQRSTPS